MFAYSACFVNTEGVMDIIGFMLVSGAVITIVCVLVAVFLMWRNARKYDHEVERNKRLRESFKKPTGL